MRLFTTTAATLASTISVVIGSLCVGFFATGCGSGSDDEPEVTRADFCERWAVAACSSEVVSVCQASNVRACQSAQSTACLDELPQTFIDRGVDKCIGAVRRAYEDADLTAAELDIVLRFGGPCSDVIIAGDSGEACETDSECEPALSCVLKNEAEGTCQQPVTIEPGYSCSEPEETCQEGFYCDGRNCIAALRKGDDCSNDVQCGSDMFCDEICSEKVDVGEGCDSDASCVSGICYEVGAERSCIDRLRLSPAEPLCAELK